MTTEMKLLYLKEIRKQLPKDILEKEEEERKKAAEENARAIKENETKLAEMLDPQFIRDLLSRKNSEADLKEEELEKSINDLNKAVAEDTLSRDVLELRIKVGDEDFAKNNKAELERLSKQIEDNKLKVKEAEKELRTFRSSKSRLIKDASNQYVSKVNEVKENISELNSKSGILTTDIYRTIDGLISSLDNDEIDDEEVNSEVSTIKSVLGEMGILTNEHARYRQLVDEREALIAEKESLSGEVETEANTYQPVGNREFDAGHNMNPHTTTSTQRTQEIDNRLRELRREIELNSTPLVNRIDDLLVETGSNREDLVRENGFVIEKEKEDKKKVKKQVVKDKKVENVVEETPDIKINATIPQEVRATSEEEDELSKILANAATQDEEPVIEETPKNIITPVVTPVDAPVEADELNLDDVNHEVRGETNNLVNPVNEPVEADELNLDDVNHEVRDEANNLVNPVNEPVEENNGDFNLNGINFNDQGKVNEETEREFEQEEINVPAYNGNLEDENEFNDSPEDVADDMAEDAEFERAAIKKPGKALLLKLGVICAAAALAVQGIVTAIGFKKVNAKQDEILDKLNNRTTQEVVIDNEETEKTIAELRKEIAELKELAKNSSEDKLSIVQEKIDNTINLLEKKYEDKEITKSQYKEFSKRLDEIISKLCINCRDCGECNYDKIIEELDQLYNDILCCVKEKSPEKPASTKKPTSTVTPAPVATPTPIITTTPVNPIPTYNPEPTWNPLPTPNPTQNPVPTPDPTQNPVPTPDPTQNPVPTPDPTVDPTLPPYSPNPTEMPLPIPDPIIEPSPAPTFPPDPGQPLPDQDILQPAPTFEIQKGEVVVSEQNGQNIQVTNDGTTYVNGQDVGQQNLGQSENGNAVVTEQNLNIPTQDQNVPTGSAPTLNSGEQANLESAATEIQWSDLFNGLTR